MEHEEFLPQKRGENILGMIILVFAFIHAVSVLFCGSGPLGAVIAGIEVVYILSFLASR